MRFGGLKALVLGFAVLVGAGTAASAQVAFYGDFSASKLTNLTNTYVLYGPTVGLQDDLGTKFGLTGGFDIRGGFYGGSQRLDEISFGPRVSGHVKGFMPYGEFLVGLARYNDGLGRKSSGTTDEQFELNVGLDRMITPRFDVRFFEFGYQEYFALGGQFNPKTFSAGVVYHLRKR